jgi:hypothetical protein
VAQTRKSQCANNSFTFGCAYRPLDGGGIDLLCALTGEATEMIESETFLIPTINFSMRDDNTYSMAIALALDHDSPANYFLSK